jgi:hypothetical protein
MKTASNSFFKKSTFKEDFSKFNKNTLKEDFFSKFDLYTYQEDFFSKKIIVDKYEIYPYNNLKILFSQSKSIANASINPLAIVIKDKNEDEYFIHLFDDSKKDNESYIVEILEKFADFTNL